MRSRAEREEEMGNCKNFFIHYVTGTSEKLRRVFNKYHISVHLKRINTLRQKLRNTQT